MRYSEYKAGVFGLHNRRVYFEDYFFPFPGSKIPQWSLYKEFSAKLSGLLDKASTNFDRMPLYSIEGVPVAVANPDYDLEDPRGI